MQYTLSVSTNCKWVCVCAHCPLLYVENVSDSPASSLFFLSLLQLREEFDRGIDIQLDEEHSIHDVAALLKEFLRDMPDPLLTKELYTPFINTTRTLRFSFYSIFFSLSIFFIQINPVCPTFAVLDADEQQNVTQLLIYLLPACNSDTLHRLLEFLSTVTDHAPDKQDKDGQEVNDWFYLCDLKDTHQVPWKMSSGENLEASKSRYADWNLSSPSSSNLVGEQ